MKNDDNKEYIYIIIAVAVICVIASLLSYAHEKNNVNNTQYVTSPTAGVTYYMGRLQYWSLQMAEPDMDVVEAAVTPVAASMESDIPEEPFDEEAPEPKYDLNNQEELAHVIYCEVGNLGEDAMYYCGSVVLNRVEDDRFPGDIHNVIFQSGQYSCTTDGNWQKFSNIPDICWEIAEDLLVNGSVIPPDVIFQAQFVQGPIWKQVGNTYFCY